jgi:hypothetical protein
VKPAHLISCATLLALGACHESREPAERILTDVDVATLGAGPDAVKYVPDQVTDVETKIGALHAAFERHDYATVVRDAPAVLTEAQGLASAAAAKKAEVQQKLGEQWTALSGAVSGDLAMLQHRLEFLDEKAQRKRAARFDLAAAHADLEASESLWSKAQGAFGNGNLDEAVTAARQVKQRLEDLAPRLEITLQASPPGMPRSARPAPP